MALCTWMILIFLAAHADTRQAPSATEAGHAPTEQSNPDSTTPNQNENEPQHSHHGAFVAVPVPISSPALGTGATVLAGYIFPLIAKDKVSPPSIIGGAGLFTNNGTRAFVIGTELYFNENRYHVLARVAHGDLNYDFYGIGNEAGNTGLKLGLKQTGTIVFGEALRRVGWKLDLVPGEGVVAVESHATTKQSFCSD